MNEKLPELRNCKICKHEKVEEVERQFLSETLTGRESAEILDCTQSAFKNHIEKHLKRDIAGVLSANAGPLAKSIFNKTNEMIRSCDRVLLVLDAVLKEWKDKKKPEWVTAFVKLETVLSNNIERLTKIQGELRESSTMRVEQLNIQVNNMTQELIEGMCSACKQKLAPKILKVVNLDETTKKIKTQV